MVAEARWLLDQLVSLLSNVAVLGLIALLCRKYIAAWIVRSVQHSYDKTLEELRVHNERELTRIRGTLDTQRELVSTAFSEARRASNDRRLEAIQMTWNAMVQIGHEAAPTVVMTDMFTTPELYNEALQKLRGDIPTFDQVAAAYKETQNRLALPVEKARLLVGEYLYAIYSAYSAFIGSIGLRIALDGIVGQFQAWWEHENVLTVLKSVLMPEEMEEFKTLKIGRYMRVIRNLEGKFLKAAEEILDGRRAAADASEQARKIIDAASSAMKAP